MALDMLDVAERAGVRVELDCLSRAIGAPVVPTVAVYQGGRMLGWSRDGRLVRNRR